MSATEQDLTPIFSLDSYDERIDKLCILSGESSIDYKEVTARLQASRKPQFIEAACNHLATALGLFRDLPWRP